MDAPIAESFFQIKILFSKYFHKSFNLSKLIHKSVQIWNSMDKTQGEIEENKILMSILKTKDFDFDVLKNIFGDFFYKWKQIHAHIEIYIYIYVFGLGSN